MITRSQSKNLHPCKEQTVIDTVIDFEEATREWTANKRRLNNGCYRYVCGTPLLSGKFCQRLPSKGGCVCPGHSKK